MPYISKGTSSTIHKAKLHRKPSGEQGNYNNAWAKMSKALPNIKEDISQLENMLKTEKYAYLKERILALYLIKTKQAKTSVREFGESGFKIR